MATVIAENLVETTPAGEFKDKPLEHIKRLIGEGVAAGLTPPDDAPVGAVPVKTESGLEWREAGRGIESIKPVNPSLALVTYTDGSTQTLPISTRLEWSKDAQAEAQGFWTVVSEDEPAQTTYRTASGKVVPIIWEKPVQVLAPVIPQAPEWNHLTGTVLVPDLTGVEYRLGGRVIPPNTLFKVSATFPFTAVVEAVAKPGFFLPNAFTWEHRFPDVTRRVLYASDSFSTDGKHERPMDMAAGGTAAPAPLWTVTTGAATTTEPYFVAKGGVLTPETTGTGNTWLSTRIPHEDFRFEFDLLSAGTGTFSFGFVTKLSKLNQYQGSLELEFNAAKKVYFTFAQGSPEFTKQYAKVRTEQELVGHWVVEVIGQTVTIIDPTGKQGNLVIDDAVMQRTPRNGFTVRNYRDTSGVQLDNFKFYTYQY